MAQKEVWKLENRALESAFRKTIKNDDEEASHQAQRKIQDIQNTNRHILRCLACFTMK